MYTEKEKKEIEFLLKQYVQGNEHVYESILQKTSAKVRCVIDYMGIEENYVSIVMDSTHNFVKENLASVQDLSKFCDWLTAVAAIQAYYTLISYGLETLDADCRESNGYQNIKQRIDDDIELTKMLAISEKSDFIWDKCKTMPAVARVTYLLYFVAEMSIDEISSTMNCSSDVVKERVNYIVATLKNDSTDYVRQESEGKKTKNKKTITIVLIILLVMFILDLVLFFVIMGQKKDKAGSGGKGEARETDVAAECETETDATVLDTTSTSNSFDENIYTDKYEKWKSIYESESMPESLGQKYNEELTAFQQAISAKDEQGCIDCDEKLDALYSEVKSKKLNDAYMRYMYDTGIYLLRYPVGDEWTLPDGTVLTDEYILKYLDTESYSIYDFDSDGKLELCLNIVLAATSNSTMSHFVYEYNVETKQWIKQFEMMCQDMPILFFDNGTIWYSSSRAEGRADEWLGFIYGLNEETNIYEKIYSVHRRDANTLFYLADKNGDVIYDNLNRSELEEKLLEVVGNPMEIEFCSIMDTPYVEDKLSYYQLLWKYNGVTGSDNPVDLGEIFLCNQGDVDKTLENVKQFNYHVTVEADFNYCYSADVEIIEGNDYGFSIKNTKELSVFGVVPGMTIEEAKKQLELHGISYCGEQGGYVDYVVDKTYGGERIRMYVENGKVIYIYIGTLT